MDWCRLTTLNHRCFGPWRARSPERRGPSGRSIALNALGPAPTRRPRASGAHNRPRMDAAATCQRLIAAVNARDWAAAGAIVDADTEVTDHRDLPFTGTGADMLGVWRSTFDRNAAVEAGLDVVDTAGDRALVRMTLGDPEGRLTVHVVAAVRDGRIATFDAYERGPGGLDDARAQFAER